MRQFVQNAMAMKRFEIATATGDRAAVRASNGRRGLSDHLRVHAKDGQPGGARDVDDAFLRQFAPGIGAEIMGAGKFGYPGWQDDPEWKGWWGSNPPFHRRSSS